MQPDASAARYPRQGLLQRNPHVPQHATTCELTRFPMITLVRPRNRHKSNIVTDCCMSDAPSAQDVGGRLSSARGSVELGWAPINRLGSGRARSVRLPTQEGRDVEQIVFLARAG